LKNKVTELIDLEYHNNFITDVIFRIDYSPILKISENIPSDLQDKIRDVLPEFSENKIIKIESVLENKKFLNKEPQISQEWQFTNKDKSMIANLSHENLNIIVKKYKNFEAYRNFLMKILNYFHEIYKPIEVKRVGLRYINNVTVNNGNPINWEDYINDKLIYQIKGFVEDSSKISRILGQICLKMEEFNIIFNYGISNPEYPLRIAKKQFILDYDCYAIECEFEEIEKFLKNFNFEIKKMFENSIKDNLRKIMGAINE